jgi:hypothetical protein
MIKKKKTINTALRHAARVRLVAGLGLEKLVGSLVGAVNSVRIRFGLLLIVLD